MFESVLVANRGEIARRIIATARRMGIRTIAVYSEADQALPYVHEADEALLIGPAPPARSYLDVAAVIGAARCGRAAAVHPGYGFLAENAGFAQLVIDEGLIWVGPPPAAIGQMGDKINARNLMEKAGVPVSAGSREPVADEDTAAAEAARIGYPVMVKAAGGGGGIGMSAARDEQQLRAAFGTARSRAERFFGNPAILVERYLPRARHVEVQILGLASGEVIALGERDCSVQRRHQKVAEETPSPGVTPQLRERMLEAAVRAGEAVAYRGAGTVECLVDVDTGEFSFLEMNTRLQVEHPVTELVTGIDLVEQQFLIAAGEQDAGGGATAGLAGGGARPGLAGGRDPADRAGVAATGHALELRIYAEDPRRFLPSPGEITEWVEPAGPGVRVDAGYAAGTTVTPFYDPLLAKLCLHGASRDEALARARDALAAFRITGPKTNLAFHAELLANGEFVSGIYDTGLVDRMRA
ncbi:MAG TPA: biotin carboxylase N-terminal domain-containing protein [Streptosporangiaceae bacterium]|nr:biotin carboxylase N-terminal domain-containing protein [Streptosporangiaceae bacterium]